VSKRRRLLVLINTSICALGLAACGGGPPPRYALEPTKSCLEKKTNAVVALEAEDVAAYAIPARLAPRSVSVFHEEDTIILVFDRDADAADDVARDVFQAFKRAGDPRDIYRRGNAFFFGPDPLSEKSIDLVESCLREVAA
jgi:hypothetical protein